MWTRPSDTRLSGRSLTVLSAACARAMARAYPGTARGAGEHVSALPPHGLTLSDGDTWRSLLNRSLERNYRKLAGTRPLCFRELLRCNWTARRLEAGGSSHVRCCCRIAIGDGALRGSPLAHRTSLAFRAGSVLPSPAAASSCSAAGDDHSVAGVSPGAANARQPPAVDWATCSIAPAPSAPGDGAQTSSTDGKARFAYETARCFAI
jgi:hypothetical protein